MVLDSSQTFITLCFAGIKEGEKAMVAFPQPNYVLLKFAEESGEVIKAAIHVAEEREDIVNLRKEMRQTIAMMYRLWIEGDQTIGLKSVGDEA